MDDGQQGLFQSFLWIRGGRTQCVRKNTGVLSSDGKNQRSPGDGSDERLRGAGAHSHLSPGPPLRGTPSCVLGQFQPAGKTKSDFPSCPGGTGPYNVAGGYSIQKGNEVSHKAFLPTFFSKKVGKRGVGWQTGYSLVCCVRRTNFITWRKPIWTMKKSVL